MAGIEKFKEISINNAIAGILSSIGLVFASKYYALNAVVIAFGFNFVLLFILNFITLKKFFYSNFNVKIFNKDNLYELEVLWKFSFPAILAGLMVGPVSWFCNYLLVNQPNGYVQMANFDIANQWRNTIMFIPAALAQVALPLLASNIHNQSEYKKIFNKNLKINIYLGLFLVMVFVFISPVIVNFYGERYHDALWPIIIMFITTGFITVNNVIGQAIASQGKMWIGFYFNLIWAVVLVFACYFFVEYLQMGAYGISLSYLLSYFVHTIIQFVYLKKLVD